MLHLTEFFGPRIVSEFYSLKFFESRVVSKSCSPQFFESRIVSNETKSNMCDIGLCDVSFLANCTFVDRVLGDYYS
jgi:hypothetical protein